MTGRRTVHRLRPWLAVTLAGLAAFVASWNVAPPPTRALLMLNVAAPEVGLWLAAVALPAATLALADAARRWPARTALPLALFAAAVGLRPLVLHDDVAARAEQTLREQLGADYLSAVPPEVRARLAPAALDWGVLLLGNEPAPARVTRGAASITVEGVELRLDVYRPDFDGTFPAVVQVYGGAWQRGGPAENARFARRLASLGLVVFAVDYRHAPGHRWPAQLEDMRRWLAWIREHAGEWQADPARVATFGRSSGSQLAMIAAWEEDAPPVAGVVGWYGPVDLEVGYRDPPDPDPLDTRAISRALIGGTPDEYPGRFGDASPLRYADRPQPPTFMVYAGRDPVVRPAYGAALRDRLRGHGNTAALVTIPWASHAFDAIPNGPSAQLAEHFTERFLLWALYREAEAASPAGGSE